MANESKLKITVNDKILDGFNIPGTEIIEGSVNLDQLKINEEYEKSGLVEKMRIFIGLIAEKTDINFIFYSLFKEDSKSSTPIEDNGAYCFIRNKKGGSGNFLIGRASIFEIGNEKITSFNYRCNQYSVEKIYELIEEHLKYSGKKIKSAPIHGGVHNTPRTKRF